MFSLEMQLNQLGEKVFLFFFFLLSNQDENSCTYQAAYNGIRIYLLETFALGYIIFKKYH